MAPPSLSIVNDDGEWDRFIYSSPQCNPFMLSAYIHSLHVESARYFYTVGGQPEASILILNPEAEAYRAPYKYTLYQGIAYANTSKQGSSLVSWRLKTTQALLKLLNEVHLSHSICLHPTIVDLRAFQWYNYNGPSDYRYVIDLAYTGIIPIASYASYEEYLKTVRAARRADLKKALGAGFNVVENSNIENFLRVYELTFMR